MIFPANRLGSEYLTQSDAEHQGSDTETDGACGIPEEDHQTYAYETLAHALLILIT